MLLSKLKLFDPRCLYFCHEAVQIFSSEFPLERICNFFIVSLEVQYALLKSPKREEIIGSKSFSLEYGKVDLDLIKPTCMDRAMDKDEIGIFFFETGDRFGTPMRRSIINDPEHFSCISVGGLGHHLIHQAAKGGNAAFMFATSKELHPVDIECGKISPCLSRIVTSNLAPKEWVSIFSATAVSAILDRQSFNGRRITFEGRSYRLLKKHKTR